MCKASLSRDGKVQKNKKIEIISLFFLGGLMLYVIFVMIVLVGGCQFGLENDRFHFHEHTKNQNAKICEDKIDMHFGPQPPDNMSEEE